MGWSELAGSRLSGSVTQVLTIPGTVMDVANNPGMKRARLMLEDVIPDSAGGIPAEISVQLGTGVTPTFHTGGSDYRFSFHLWDDGQISSASEIFVALTKDRIDLTDRVANLRGHWDQSGRYGRGWFDIYAPQTTGEKLCMFEFAYPQQFGVGDGDHCIVRGHATFLGSTLPITSIRIRTSVGNFGAAAELGMLGLF